MNVKRLVGYVALATVNSTIVGVAATSGGCTTDYQLGLEDPKFGAPNALAGQKQPGPSSQSGADGQQAGGTPECVKSGGQLIDAGTCAISFKTNILPAFQAANCQTGSCHGGTSPPNQPRIDPADSNGMWNEFAAFKISNPATVPYINPCSTDPTKSTIGCNVNKAAPCGSLMPPSLGLPANVVTDIETWVKCGAPNN